MGRFRDLSADDGSETGIDMSPLIDCVFILLIFFIVTTTFVEETGVEVDKPQAAASAVRLEKTSVLIALTQNNGVFAANREIGIAGVQPYVKRMLQQENVPVIVQADAGANTGMLVRIIDEAKLAGALKVSVSTSPSGG
jgi:biopolymer transport protein ExbD